MHTPSRRLSATLLLFALAACSGTGGTFVGPTAPPSGGGTTGSGSSTNIPLTVKIAAKAAPSVLKRKPGDLSASTQSLAVFAYSQGTTQPSKASGTFNIAAGSNGCVQNPDNSLTCTLTVTGPSGNDDVTLVAYSGSNGTGSILSQATVTVNASANMAPVAVTTSSSVVSQIRLTPETPMLAAGAKATSKIDVNAYDPGGNLILASGSFASAVSLSSDSSTVSLSSASVTTPGAQIVASYNGSSAPYSVHIAATGANVPSNMIVGATLNIVPSQSFAILGGWGGAPLYATYATTANNEPPQSFNPLSAIATPNTALSGFAALPNGSFAVSAYGNNTCTLSVVNGASLVAHTSVTSSNCAVATTGTGKIVLLDGSSGSQQIQEFTVSGSTLTSVATIALNASSLPAGVTSVSTIAADATGNIATVGLTSSGYAVIVFANGATTGTQLATFSAPSGFGTFTPLSGLTYSPDGKTIAVLVDNCCGTSKSSYAIDSFSTATGALSGPILSPACASNYCGASGVGIDAAGETMVAVNSYPQSGPVVDIDVYAAGATVPTRTITLSGAGRMTQVQTGPVFINAPSTSSPTTPSVSGDMMGYQASRTWTYRVTPADTTIAPYVFGMYADPQLVSGNERFVGYLAANGSTDPFTGTKVGSLDLLATPGGYQAEAFASVSSGTNGITASIPGAPLFVPNTLAVNQTWNPLQNAPIASFLGVATNAQVLSVAAAANASACPSGTGTQGATVQYSVTSSGAMSDSYTATYIPGCGITRIVADDGSVIDLTAVGSQASLGQVTVPQGQPAIVGALHALWQHTLRKPH